ncbi:MAG: rhodanese-like domain-containing protein [Treponema sp.]|nr:rhodanese-like domain-containing protein [Treponema sp.]
MPKQYYFLFMCISILSGCISAEMRGTEGYHSITAKEAYKMISELEEYIILDVRTESERQKKYIPGSISIPFRQIKDRADNELPDKNAMIFVHCLSGGRSTIAARELISLGYTNVYDFKKITRWPGELIRD